MKLVRSLVSSLLLVAAFTACAENVPPRDLAELVVQDSTYYTPESMLPYTGPVFRAFADDPEVIQIEGSLLEGTWHGELSVYHKSGRIRYLGSFYEGARCGPWVENADDEEPQSLYAEVVREIETLGMYPPCPEGTDG